LKKVEALDALDAARTEAVSGGAFVSQLTAILAGLFLGASCSRSVGKEAAARSPWKHFQVGALVLVVGVGFFGLGLLAGRVDSRLLDWISYAGMVGCVVYGWLHGAGVRGRRG
jgi:hypothetical protein